MVVQFGYRHRQIARFAVEHGGELFEFKDGILVIQNRNDEDDSSVEARNANFLRAWQGMEMRDRNAIIKLEVVENEHQITEADLVNSRAIRGPVSTSDIKAPVSQQNINSGAAKVPGIRLTPTGIQSSASAPAEGDAAGSGASKV